MASSHSSVKVSMGVSRVTGHAVGSVAVVPPSGGRVLYCGFCLRVRGCCDRAGGAHEGGDGRRARVLGPGQGQCGVREVADRPVGDPGPRVAAGHRRGREEHGAAGLGEAEDLGQAYVRPPFGFGAHNPGTKTGTYRLGTDVLVTDADGDVDISGADFADEIEKPVHHKSRFTLGY
jgi:hypothetical protein